MLSPGLDEGLRGMCINEKRTITLSSDVGLIDIPTGHSQQSLFQFLAHDFVLQLRRMREKWCMT